MSVPPLPAVSSSSSIEEEAAEAAVAEHANIATPPSKASASPAGRSQQPVYHLVFPHLLDTFRSLVSVIVIALFVLTFIVQPFRIPSESMERTLLVGDFLLVNKIVDSPAGSLWFWALPYRHIQRGDIIVFHFPVDPSEHLVKRVIGVPGDRIRLVNGAVFLNGKALREPYAIYSGSYPDEFRDQFPDGQYTDPGVDAHWWLSVRHSVKDGEIVVPADHYFVLGDNRNNSRDSRYWGYVPRSNIVGRPFVIYFSVRELSGGDLSPLPGDRLAHPDGLMSALMDFARWERMFQIVR